MIDIDLFQNKKSKIDNDVIRYINENLRVMVEVYRDYLYDYNGNVVMEILEDVFPRDFIKRNKAKCINIIDELYELIISRSIRDYIKPKYEYALYYIIIWWIETRDYEEEYIPVKLTENLRDKIMGNKYYLNEDGENVILNQLSNIKNYLDFCFWDYDFRQDSLDSMVNLYIKYPELVSDILHVDLDEYVDFMSVDLRELYIERKKEENNNTNVISKWSEELIIKELYNSLNLLSEHIMEIKEKSEVEISNEIFRMNKRLLKCKYGLELEREAEIGHSKEKLGETDFYIYQNGDDYINIAIGENKLLEGFSNAYGQVLGYLNYNFNFGFTISISKKKTIRDAYDYIIKNLMEKDDEEFKIKAMLANFVINYI
ncbi:hypothetical protein [Clostridium perfringens]|uniref:hypothetical protein n=1 Tax=Clostridium perfringens TaxID=1502 RepID=UPI002ACD9B30|nr:hypothetical protein [Clostridium perfringens]MDZ7545548.1 hypothetical protein [Clostridium perfringens]